MTQRDWRNDEAHTLGVFLNGEEITDDDASAARRSSTTRSSLLFNAHHEPMTFTLPTRRFGARWQLELSTAEPDRGDGDHVLGARARTIDVESRSIVAAAPCRVT